jgi:hypothetical protein
MKKEEAEKMYLAASFFDSLELTGWYKVKMVSLPTIPGHKKCIFPGVIPQKGFNQVVKPCLFFDIINSTNNGMVPVVPVLLIYRNGRVMDELKKISDGYYIGRFNVIVKRAVRFLDYFTLEKIDG